MNTLSATLVLIALIAIVVLGSVFAGWSHRRTRRQARLMKMSLGMYVSNNATDDGGFAGSGIDGGGLDGSSGGGD